MDDVILFVWQRLYRSPYFQEFLHELRQLTRPQLLERIEEMKEWCSDQIDELCDLPEAEINLGYNWNVHMWLLPMENCFSFFHPAEDLINGLSGVKLIGYGPGDSPYRIHRDALGKSSSAIDLNKLEVRFALAYPLFQVIMLATHIPMNVATFIHRQATECFGFENVFNHLHRHSRIPDNVMTEHDRAKLIFWLVLTNIYEEVLSLLQALGLLFQARDG